MREKLIEYNHKSNNFNPDFPEHARIRNRKDENETAQPHNSANIVGTITIKETIAQPSASGAENAIKKTIFQQCADQPAPREVTPPKRDTRPSNRRGRIKRTTEEEESVSSDDDYFVRAVANSFQANKIRANKRIQQHKHTVTVRLNDVDIRWNQTVELKST